MSKILQNFFFFSFFFAEIGGVLLLGVCLTDQVSPLSLFSPHWNARTRIKKKDLEMNIDILSH